MIGSKSYSSISDASGILNAPFELESQRELKRSDTIKPRNWLFTLGISSFSLLIIVATLQSNFPAKTPNLELLAKSHSIGEVYFETSNSLTRVNPLSIAHPWKIVEPYRRTEFRACSSTQGVLSTVGEVSCAFEVDGVALEPGCTVETEFTATGPHSVKLTVTSPEEVVEHSEEVACKYIRREFRALPVEEQTGFLDALQTLYRVPQEEGEALYGPRYKSMGYFVLKHLLAGADRSCDHWHDSPAVGNTHSAFTLELEQALQVIDPTVSVPYWDYVSDIEQYGTDYLEKSEIFEAQNFGSPSPGGHSHAVQEGRWAYTKIPVNEARNIEEVKAVTSPYGILRSPWNLNPYPYLTRATDLYGVQWDKLPYCEIVIKMFQTKELSRFLYYLNGLSHGPIHIMTGGAWNSPHEKLLGQVHANGHNVLYTKHLWRTGFMRCPDTCSKENQEDCVCSCPSEITDNYTPYDILHYETNILHWMETFGMGSIYRGEDDRFHFTGVVEKDEASKFADLLSALCNPGYVGEMFTSASPNDPLFWIIHPTIERLWFWKNLNPDVAPYKSQWGYVYGHDPSDTGTVCDWTKVTGNAMPACTKSKDCPGTQEFDEISFSKFLETEGDELYTNREYLDFAMPDNIDLPYTYDNFEYSYCDSGNEQSPLNIYGDLQ